MSEVLFRNLMKTSDIVRPIKLVTIKAEILYPMIGWYKARPYSIDYGMFAPLSGAQIRGLWRWWMRTALATLRCGQTTIEEMDREIGKLLGSTRNSSRFWIVVRENEVKRAEMEEFARKLKEKLDKKVDSTKPIDKELPLKLKIPRIRLITQPMEGEKKEETEIKNPSDLEEVSNEEEASNEIAGGFKRYLDRVIEHVVIPLAVFNKFESREVEIDLYYLPTVEDEPIESCVPFALASLLTALLLDGVGGIKNRGFGSVLIRSIEIHREKNSMGPHSSIRGETLEELVKIKESFIEGIVKKSEEGDLESGIRAFIKDNLMKYAKKCFKVPEGAECKELPMIPCLCIDEGHFRLKVMATKWGKGDIHKILKALGETTLKSSWKKGGKKQLGYPYHTWILGLPRKSKETGYYVDFSGVPWDRGEERRQSSISFTLFVPKESDKVFVIVKGFLTQSLDWFFKLNGGRSRLKYRSPVVGKKAIPYDIKEAISCDGKSEKLPVDETNEDEYVKKIFDIAWDCVIKLSKKKLGGGR